MFPDGTVQTTAATGGGGTVTSVGSGLGLTGGPITTSGTLAIDPSKVPLLGSSNTFAGGITAPAFTSNTAPGFIGDGSMLSNVNALTLGGNLPSAFASTGSNAFNGNQTITGGLTVSGNLGVGTTTPSATLDVNGTINAANQFNLGGQPFAFSPTAVGGPNVYLGFAGNFSTTGGQNTGAGQKALASNTTGLDNAAFGYSALRSNTVGGGNSAFGSAALYAFTGTTGLEFNTAVGSAALSFLTTGAGNIAVGANAGGNLQGSESNNIYIGHRGVTGESNTIRIGDPTLQPNGNIYIGNNGMSGDSGTIRIGTPGTQTATYLAGNVSTNGTIQSTSGGFKFPDGSVQTSAAGTLSMMNTFTGQNVFTAAPTGTSVGQGSLYIDPGTANPGQTLFGAAVGGSQQMLLDTSGDLTISGNLSLPATIAATAGVINLGMVRFAHAFGASNTFVGQGSGNFSMTGTQNTAIGQTALQANTAGSQNTATGAGTLAANTDGTANTATGEAALFNNTSGSSNTAGGAAALSDNTTGKNNTADGSAALPFNTTGSGNTALGANAGREGTANQFTTGSLDTYIGSFTGPTAGMALDNATAIGALATVSQSNSLVLGSIGNVNGCLAASTPPCTNVSVGIGTATPAAALDVEGTGNGTGTMTLQVGGNATITGNLNVTGIVTCGSGCSGGGGGGGTVTSVTGTAPLTVTNGTTTPNISIATGGITNALLQNSGVTISTVNGLVGGGLLTLGSLLTLSTNATPSNTGATIVLRDGSGNFSAGSVTLGANLTLPSTNSSGTAGVLSLGGNPFLHSFGDVSNTFVGASAGNFTLTSSTANATGIENTGIGLEALTALTTGSDNTAIGGGALQSNTTGRSNTAAGLSALIDNISGSDNTAVGQGAIFKNTTGSNNTAVGTGAGGAAFSNPNTTGSNNTFLGYESGLASTTQWNNATAIGANAAVNCSDCMVLGSINGVNGATNSTNVGIGTATPGQALEVVGNIKMDNSTGTNYGLIFPDGTVQSTAATGGGGGSGTVTSITAGNGLTANGTAGASITTSGTLAINTAVVPQLAAVNMFTGNNTFAGNNTFGASPLTSSNTFFGLQTISGNLQVMGAPSGGTISATSISAGSITATGSISAGSSATVSGGTVVASNGFSLFSPSQTVLTMVNPSISTSNSIFLGFGAGNPNAFNNTALNNTALGSSSLSSLASFNASGNTASGASALAKNTMGANNTANGYLALGSLATGNSNIAIGQAAGSSYTSESNNIVIGNSGVASDSGMIRIGTTGTHTATVIAGISGATSASGIAVLVNSAGQLGTTTSSRRFKHLIADMGAESGLLMKLRPVAFYYKPELDETQTRQYGLVAEEVAQIAPQLVVFDKDGQPQTVRYHFVNAMLLNEVQRQRRLLDEQQKENEEQRSIIGRQEAEIQALAERLARLEAQANSKP
jgi:hypothetical protein